MARDVKRSAQGQKTTGQAWEDHCLPVFSSAAMRTGSQPALSIRLVFLHAFPPAILWGR
jgi:hypothetical protein